MTAVESAVTEPVEELPESFIDALGRFAREKPDEVAIYFNDSTMTWAQLDEGSTLVAKAMHARGANVDDLVTMALGNSIDFLVATCAIWKVGATPQPLSVRLAPKEFADIVALGKPPIVVGDPSSALAAEADVPMISVGQLSAEADPASVLPQAISASFKAPTSGGSTGRPKIIMSGKPARVDELAVTLWDIQPDDRLLVTAPMHHNAPFSLAIITMTTGIPAIVMERFDAEKVLAAIEKYRCTWVYAVPIMMHRIDALPDDVKAKYDLSSLRSLWHLAAPCPAWLKHKWIDWLGVERIWELYGGTEGQSGTTLQGTEWLAHEGSVGMVKFGEMKILDDEGNEVPAGVSGELWMRRSPGNPQSYRYLGASAKQLDERDENSDDDPAWESLGDIGRFDEDGYLYLHDRLSDMILVGGVNVFPAEVEAALDEFPAVRSSAVVGFPDDEYGNRVHAIIEADPTTDLDALGEHLAARLSPHKRPRSIEIVDQPLRDATGKSRRSALRAQRLTD